MLKSNYLVTKSNVLNEMRYKDMTLQEMRLFTVYLSRIDKDKVSTRRVKFSLNEFRSLMNLNPTTSITYIRSVTEHLLSHVVTEPKGTKGSYRQYQIFKTCEVDVDTGTVCMDAHDDVLPLMFEYKNRFLRYKLWNTLHLTSTNQIRMYELLKQYENTEQKSLTISLVDLKEKLDIDPEDYSRWDNFKARIIVPCQKALKEKTDICFEYSPIKSGKATVALKFTIEKNEDYDHQLSLDDYIDESKTIKSRSDFETDLDYYHYVESLPQDIREDIIAEELKLNDIENYKKVVDYSFSENEMSILYDTLYDLLPGADAENEDAREEALHEAYSQLKRYEKVQKIESRFGYLLKTLKNNYQG